MNCSDARQKLQALLDTGTQEPPGSAGDGAAAQHVAGCADCRDALERGATVDALLRSGLAAASSVAVPDGYFEDLWSRAVEHFAKTQGQENAMSENMSNADDERPGKNGGVAKGPTVNDKSGLHDIRDLARTTLERRAQSHPDEDQDLGAAPVSLGQVVLPKPGRRGTLPGVAPRRHPIVVLGLGVLLMGVGAAVAVVVMKAREPVSSPGVLVAATSERAGAGAGETGPIITGPIADEADEVGHAAEGGTDTNVRADTGGTPAGGVSESRADKASRRAVDVKKAGANAGAASSPKSGDKTGPGDKAGPATAEGGAPSKDPAQAKDDISAMIDNAMGAGATNSSKSSSTASDEGANLPDQLSRHQVQSGMRKANGAVKKCYEKFKERGNVMVKIKIATDGSITTAEATGKFAGTPSGECVVDAVKKTSFPKFRGPSMTVTFPFLLS